MKCTILIVVAFVQKNYRPFVLYKSLFSREECEHIMHLGLNLNLCNGTIEDGKTNYVFRTSMIGWVLPNDETQWLFDKVYEIVQACNRDMYHFDLSSALDKLQYTEYHAGGYYDWHQDLSKGPLSLRKLSITVQLSEPDAYDGGEMEFFNYGTPQVPKTQGTVAIFPSYVPHRVRPVTRGVRKSLVAWATGPHFR